MHLLDYEKVASYVASLQQVCGSTGHSTRVLFMGVNCFCLCEHVELCRSLGASHPQIAMQEDGSFWGDEWGEVDTRFSYCAYNCLTLLGRYPIDALYCLFASTSVPMYLFSFFLAIGSRQVRDLRQRARVSSC